MGVVVRRYIDFLIILLIPTPLLLALFAAASLLFCLFLFMLFLCNIANVAQRTFKIVQKSRSHGHGNITISARTCICVDYDSRDFHVRSTKWRFTKVAADFVYDYGIVEVSFLHVRW